MEEIKLVVVLFLLHTAKVQPQTTNKVPVTYHPNAEYDLTVIPISGYQGQVGFSWQSGMKKGNTGIRKTGCAAECNSTPSCKSFDYNSEYKECFIHDYDTCPVLRRLDCPKCVHYKKNILSCVQFTQYFSSGMAQMHNANGQSAPGIYETVERCFQFCHEAPSCVLIDYNSKGKKCWWHSTSTGCTTPQSCAPCDVTQYRHNRINCPTIPTTTPTTTVLTSVNPNAGIQYDNGRKAVNYKGGKAFTFNQTKYECLNKCALDPNCQGFDLNEPSKTCWFHEATTICTTPDNTCGTCVHYKNKRAACYVDFSVAEVSTTTSMPTTTTPVPIASKFPGVLVNQKLNTNAGEWIRPTSDLDGCLKLCDDIAWCQAVDFDTTNMVCLLHRDKTACVPTIKSKPGWYIYRHVRLTCGNDVFKGFTTAMANKKRIGGVLTGTSLNIVSCLNECKKKSTCYGINYSENGLKCEHIGASNKCAQFMDATGYLQYTKKETVCSNDVTASVCWNNMVMTTPSPCTKPTVPSTTTNVEDIDNYCRLYNNYFACILKNLQSTNCPNVASASLESYVNTLSDLKTPEVQFCYIFTKELQTCLEKPNVISERGQCNSAVKPTGVTKTAKPPECKKLRRYVECVQSVIDYRCRMQKMEFYKKSMRYTLFPEFSNCQNLSTPLVDNINTNYGPAKGSSRFLIQGSSLTEYGDAKIYFNDSDACVTNTLNRSDMYIWCIIKPVNMQTNIAQDDNVWVRIKYPTSVRNIYFTAGNFTYKANPTVTSLKPARTVIGGGTIVTVTGDNLVYVVGPQYEVTRVEDETGQIQKFTGHCKTNPNDMADEEKKSLICVVPEITLPSNIKVDSGKKVQRVSYWNGLLLDGEKGYANLSMAGLSEAMGNRLTVFGPPEINENPDRVYEFKTFWPVSQVTLELMGNYLDTAATSQDYEVIIHNAECKNVKITATTLTCQPPAENPHPEGKDVPISVKAPGYKEKRNVGKLNYQSSIFDNTAGRYGLIAAAFGVVFLFVMMLVICCCFCSCCPFSRNKK